MRKLYLKQEYATFGSSVQFSVYDENGLEYVRVETENFSFGGVHRIYNLHEEELACVERKLFSLKPKYVLYKDDVEVARISSKGYLQFFADGLGWTVDRGRILDGERQIAEVMKTACFLGDAYQISVEEEADVVNVIAMAIIIDRHIGQR